MSNLLVLPLPTGLAYSVRGRGIHFCNLGRERTRRRSPYSTLFRSRIGIPNFGQKPDGTAAVHSVINQPQVLSNEGDRCAEQYQP